MGYSYDYKNAKGRILDILNNSAEIQEKDRIPKDDSNFTYDNGIRSWIGSIFVDIIDSKKLIDKKEDIVVAKVLRVFTSEVISVFNASEKARQIGVRGDCVYGVFSTPNKEAVLELADMSFYVNTLMTMINKLLTSKGLPNIKVGIGVAVGKDLIIKAGRKGTGINDRIWIGKAVVDACVLADKAGRDKKGNIGFSESAYEYFIEQLKKRNEGKNVESWFTKYTPSNNRYANIVKSNFEKWIQETL